MPEFNMTALKKRFKSIDTIRGISMAWMIFGHLIDWWTKPESSWVVGIFHSFFDPIGASCFLFISGMSITLSYRKRRSKAKYSPDISMKKERNEYLIRAFLVLLVAFGYNLTVAIGTFDPSFIWAWFILLTIAMSLFLAFPLLYTSKYFRILFSTLLWFFNFIIIDVLNPFQGELGLLGLAFHIFYYPLNLSPILYFFSFFLLGTVIGDLFFEFSLIDIPVKKREFAMRKMIWPLFLIGIGFLIMSVIFMYPSFLSRRTIPWLFYSVGGHFTLIAVLFFVQDLKTINFKKNYRFFYYYSYYSLTVFLLHNVLYFLFLNQLDAFWAIIFSFSGSITIGLILNLVYKKLGAKFSLKIQISLLASSVSTKVEALIMRKR